MRRKSISSTIRSAKGPPPSAEGGEGWRRSRHKLLFRAFQVRPKDGARLAALRSPFGNLRGVTYRLVSYPTLAGRGGSVSRRDHNQAAGNRPPTHSGILYGRKTNSNRSYSSGEGVWGRGASLREAASPPESPPKLVSSEGSAREGASLQRSPLPRITRAPSSRSLSLRALW